MGRPIRIEELLEGHSVQCLTDPARIEAGKLADSLYQDLSRILASCRRENRDLQTCDTIAGIAVKVGRIKELLKQVRTIEGTPVPERKKPQEEQYRRFVQGTEAEMYLGVPDYSMVPSPIKRTKGGIRPKTAKQLEKEVTAAGGYEKLGTVRVPGTARKSEPKGGELFRHYQQLLQKGGAK